MIEITSLGYLLFLFTIFLYIYYPKILVPLLILALSLQRTAIVNFPSFDYGLQFYRFLTILIVLRFFIKVFRSNLSIKFESKEFKLLAIILIAFALYTILISICGPIIFENYPVFPPIFGIDYSAIYGPSLLKFSQLNIALPLYVFLYSIVFLYILTMELRYKELKIIFKIWNITIFITLFFVALEFLLFFVGKSDILAFINNSAQREYKIVTFNFAGYNLPRLQGTFLEPSMLAPFVVGIFIYFLDSIRRFSVIRLLSLSFLMFVLLMTTSTTAYISIFIMLLIFLYINLSTLCYFKLNRRNILKILILLCFIITFLLVFVVVNVDLLFHLIKSFILEKPNTLSFFSRIKSDIHSIKLFMDTYFIGVGYGSHRSSSLIANLLATVGLLGTLLFFFFVFMFIKIAYRKLRHTEYFKYWYLLPSALISMIIAIPDITLTTFWQFLYITTIILKLVNKMHKTYV